MADSSISPAEREQPRLLEQVRNAIRRRHYSYRTEQAYVHWIKRFIYFHDKRHPASMGADEVTAFLTYLARERGVSASTQNQALSSLLFLYGRVLEIKLPWMDGIDRAKRPVRVPVVLTIDEVRALLARLEGTKWMMASLLYGAGLRLRECLKLRVKDRMTMLPGAVIEPLRSHLARVQALHERDLAEGYGEVEMPNALARKYPAAGRQWGWQYVFPSRKRSADPRSGVLRRHHVYDDVLPRAIGRAARAQLLRLKLRGAFQPCMVSPPETLSVWPVMKFASSLARNSTAPAMSSGLPRRPIGMARR